MKKYIKSDDAESESYTTYEPDPYHRDMILGESVDEVLDADDFLNYLEDAIRFSEKSFDITSAVILESDNELPNVRVYVTNHFEKAVKRLVSDHRTDVLEDLKGTVEDLLKLNITRQSKNSPLKDAQKHFHLHIRGDVLLIYKYLSKDILAVSLKLQDIVNHKELEHYENKKYKSPTKETTVDEIFKDTWVQK